MNIVQGQTEVSVFPVTDALGVPIDVSTSFTDGCFTIYGGYVQITLDPLSAGWNVISYSATNDALEFTLEPAETRSLKAGWQHNYEVWLEGASGRLLVASGDAVVVRSEEC